MMNKILERVREKGILLDKDTFELIKSFEREEDATYFLDNFEKLTGQKIITKSVLNKNVGFVKSIVNRFPGEEKAVLEKTFVKLGISLEILNEKEVMDSAGINGRESKKEVSEIEEIGRTNVKNKNSQDFGIFYAETAPYKKLTVKDFVGNFRARYQSLQKILLDRPELQSNMYSIGKISSDRQSLSVIGIVTEKRTTKNGNMMLRFEDLTGETVGIVKNDNKELFEKAQEVMLDDVIGIKASGNKDMLFIREIFFPDSFNFDKIKFEEDFYVGFLSDVHCGSDRHLGKEFEKLLEWINSDDEIAKKLKYLFFVGDNVDGVGVFPGQEEVLDLKSMEEQYSLLASYLRKIPKHITMFMCPGQHDATRVAEPQPLIDKRYARELYEIENLILVTNPTMVKFYEGEKTFKVLMYHGASAHGFVNEIQELRLMNAYKCPAKIFNHALKRRHLAPSHGDVVYIPNEDSDPLVIKEVPDVLCTGEVHKLDIDNYNGVLVITGSCWQATTPFEEKVGHVPDPCKFPLLNLKTRELKIFDFSEEEEEKLGETGESLDVKENKEEISELEGGQDENKRTL